MSPGSDSFRMKQLSNDSTLLIQLVIVKNNNLNIFNVCITSHEFIMHLYI